MSILGIIIGIIIFSLLVFFHELGHFLAAKAVGIGVIEFSIGMGPRLFSFGKGETKYSIKAIPFGGSCAMVGEDAAGGGEVASRDDASEKQSTDEYLASLPDNAFPKKSVWARILVVAAGPIFNFILAFILGCILTACAGANNAEVYKLTAGSGAEEAGLKTGDIIVAINGYDITMGKDISLFSISNSIEDGDVTVTFIRDGKEQSISYDPSYQAYTTGISYYADDEAATISSVVEDSAAEAAGIKEGDIITKIDGIAIETGKGMQEYFATHELGENTLSITYKRGGAEFDTSVTPKYVTGYSLGFSASYNYEDASIGDVILGGIKETRYGVRAVIASIKMIASGKASVKDVSGPVGIVSVIGTTIEESKSDGALYVFINMLNISVLLSANLGIVNLLPIPAIDGGRLLVLLIEALTKKRIPPRIEEKINIVAFVILMGLMALVMFSDITKLFA